jgi:hypothetical protein
MNIQFLVIKKHEISYKNPNLWFEGDNIGTNDEYRNVSLLTEVISDKEKFDKKEFFSEILERCSSKSCHFQSLTNHQSSGNSVFKFSFFNIEGKLSMSFHSELVLRRDEVISISQKIDFMNQCSDERNVYVMLSTSTFDNQRKVEEINEIIKRNNKVNGTLSYEFPIKYYKIICG